MANKINFQKELDKLLEQHQREARVPSLFLHSCCAPCSSYVIEYLSDYFQITVLLQSEYLPGRRVSAPCKRTAASDLPDSAEVSGLFSRGRL